MSGGADARLALAFDSPPAGRTLLIGAPPTLERGLFDPAHSLVVQADWAAHEALLRQGWTTVAAVPEGVTADRAVVFMPRARAAQHAAIAAAAAALPADSDLWIDGQKTDGIETVLRVLRDLAAVESPLSKGHGKLFRLTVPAGNWLPPDWAAKDTVVGGGFITAPGVFSADGPDPASVLLAEALPAKMPARVVDLGAGWGWLTAQVLVREGAREVHAVEADHEALRCARANLSDPRVQFHWADATRFRLPEPVNGVVMNPPFHGAGRAADPRLGAAFIRTAAGLLTAAGRLWLVANRQLPYEAELNRYFRQVEAIGGDSRFKLLTATGAKRVS